MNKKEVYLDYLHHDTQTNASSTAIVTYQSPQIVVEDDTYEYLSKDSAKILNAIRKAIAFNDDSIRKIDLIFRTVEEYNQIKEWLKDEE